jgi:hypothetical protein
MWTTVDSGMVEVSVANMLMQSYKESLSLRGATNFFTKSLMVARLALNMSFTSLVQSLDVLKPSHSAIIYWLWGVMSLSKNIRRASE